MSARIRFRRSTAAVWISVNPILTTGELGYETDTGKFKIGDNATAWTGLAYSVRAQLSEGYLNDLADVTITSPTSGQVLKWNGTAWINDTGGSAINALDDITDVTITSAASGDILKWNGSAWVNDSALLAAKAPLASPTFTGVPAAPTAAQATNTTQIATTAFVRGEVTALVNGATATLDTLGEIATALGNDANLSTTLTTSIGLKAPLASPTFTGTVSGITKTMVGLGSVDNTADTAKPVSTAQQTALDLKANLASPTFTGTPTLPTGTIATTQTAANNSTAVATTAYVDAADALKANLASPTFTGTPTLPTGTIATTQTAANNTTAVATTAYVDTADALKANIASPTFTGTVTIPSGASISGFAPLASPSLTGTPLAPTAAGGTNTTQIATTAFVTTAVSVLDNVGDVTITSAASGQLLQWNGSAWINATVSGADPVVQSMMYR